MGFKAIIVDDSKLTCRTLQDIISRDAHFEQTFTANDPYEAKSVIMENEPDLVILDIGMPRMDAPAISENHHGAQANPCRDS